MHFQESGLMKLFSSLQWCIDTPIGVGVAAAIDHRYGGGMFFRSKQCIRDSHNARTLILMKTRGQILPLGASSMTGPQILKIDVVTTDVSLLTGTSSTTDSTNVVKFWKNHSHEESKLKTWDLRYYQNSCNY
jgi:hypothetical protein